VGGDIGDRVGDALDNIMQMAKGGLKILKMNIVARLAINQILRLVGEAMYGGAKLGRYGGSAKDN